MQYHKNALIGAPVNQEQLGSRKPIRVRAQIGDGRLLVWQRRPRMAAICELPSAACQPPTYGFSPVLRDYAD
jgi:hypothetical protein